MVSYHVATSTAPLDLLGYLTFLAALVLILAFSLTDERRYRFPCSMVHRTLLLIPLATILLTYLLRGVPRLESLLAILFLTTSLYGFISSIERSGLMFSLIMSFILSSLLLTLLYGSGFPEPVLVMEILSLISSLMGFLHGGGSDLRCDVNSYSLMLIPAFVFLLAELSLVFNFLPYFITYDPIMHQYWARLLADNPRAYTRWFYVGYHSILAFTYEMAGSSPLDLVITSWTLNLIALLLVHQSFSKLRGRRLSFAAWVTFSGLSWVALLRYGFEAAKALGDVERVTYRSLTWGFPLFLWGFPLTLSLGLLSLLVFLHDEMGDSRKGELLLYASLLLLFLIHVVEAVLFALYSLLRALSGRKPPLAVTMVPITLFLLYSTWGVRGEVLLPTVVMFLLGLTALLSSKVKMRSVLKGWSSLRPFLASLYLTGIAIWLYKMGDINTLKMQRLGQVPWILYPVLLGIPGLLILISDLKEGKPFLILTLSGLLMGKLVTAYKLWVGWIPYWEYRFVLYAFLGVSAAVGCQLSRLRNRKVVGLIILLSVLSTPLSVARWKQISTSAGNVLNPADVEFMTSTNLSGPLLLFSQNSLWVAAYGPAVEWIRSPPPWIARGPETTMATLGNFSEDVDVLATLYDEALLWGMNASRSYMRGYWKSSPSIFHIRTSCIDPNSTVTVILPSDTYLRERAIDAYRLIGDLLPPHTTYLRDDPLAPRGIYLGPPTNTVELDERLPDDPRDHRWIYVRGPFLSGLKVVGDEGIAVTRFELDEGNFSLRVCPEEDNGSMGIIFEYENLRRYREVGLNLTSGTVYGTGNDGPVPRAPCYEMTLQIGPESGFVVNGHRFPMKAGGGVLGIHTVGFFGNLTGRVRGRHFVLGPREGDVLLSVVPGGRLDLSPMIDAYYGKGKVNETVRHEISLLFSKLAPESKKCGFPAGLGAAREVEASGSVVMEGRAVWIKEGGMRTYLEEEHSVVSAEKTVFRGGYGFYVVVEVERGSLNGSPVSDGSLILFRTPLHLKARGEVSVRDYHKLAQFVDDVRNVRLESIDVRVLMGDGVYLFHPSLEIRESFEPYDEFEDLLLALPIAIGMAAGWRLARLREMMATRRRE